jgi:exonuclease SbcC
MYKPQSLKIKNIISFKEQEFHFRNGKAIIIVGENLDDSSQERNGSGKSALIESLALAISGSSIRDVKAKELINNDADNGEVELTLSNTQNNDVFKIWRKLYTNTKSAEYKSWINDKEQSDRYSDLNMFNQFIWDILGISREDFFSFYLITKDNYCPFLIVGDTKKKEIINRFSGADKVDLVFFSIEEDSHKIQSTITQLERDLLQNQTKQQVLAEQLIEEENKVSDENKNKLIEEKQQQINNLLQDEHIVSNNVNTIKNSLQLAEKGIANFKSDSINYLEHFKYELKAAELEVNNFEFSKNYEKLFSELNLKKQKLESDLLIKKSELPKIKDQFKNEIDNITNEESELRKSLFDAEQEFQENEKFESEVNKQLHDSIECPNCHHHFSLRDKSFNYEEAKAKLPEVQEIIKEYKQLVIELKNQINVDIQQKKNEVNNKIIKAGEGIKNDIEILNKKIVEFGNKELIVRKEYQEEFNKKQFLIEKVSECKRKLKIKEEEEANNLQVLQNEVKKYELNLKQKEQELQSCTDQMKHLQEQIGKLQSQELDKSKIEKLQEDINQLILTEEKINNDLELKRKEKESVDAWEINFKNFKSHLANKSIKNIQDYTNLFLESMGSNLAINIDGYKTLSNKKIKEQITTSVLRDGFDAGSYGKFSGGERGRIDICTIIAMQELISLNSPKGGVDLLIADEILDQVDTLGLESIINSLQSLGKTIMIVSQNEINTLNEHTLIVQKKNKVSAILN